MSQFYVRMKRRVCAVAIVIGLMSMSASGEVSVPVEWQKARTLLGLYGEGCGENPDGIVRIKCGKANKKGIAKVSMTITPFDGKKRSYRSTSVDVSRGGEVRIEWPAQEYFVRISGNEFFGEPIYGDFRPACSPNAVWSADVGGNIPDGPYGFGSDYAFRFWWRDEEWAWQLEDLFTEGRYCINTELAMPLLSSQTFTVRNGKIDFGKKPSLKYKKGNEFPNLVGWDTAKPNIPGTKITYNAKTGILKGSFTFYTDPHVCNVYDGGKVYQLKKHSFKIAGVVLKGTIVGEGVAICKKPAFSCPVSLWRGDVAW